MQGLPVFVSTTSVSERTWDEWATSDLEAFALGNARWEIGERGYVPAGVAEISRFHDKEQGCWTIGISFPTQVSWRAP